MKIGTKLASAGTMKSIESNLIFWQMFFMLKIMKHATDPRKVIIEIISLAKIERQTTCPTRNG